MAASLMAGTATEAVRSFPFSSDDIFSSIFITYDIFSMTLIKGYEQPFQYHHHHAPGGGGEGQVDGQLVQLHHCGHWGQPDQQEVLQGLGPGHPEGDWLRWGDFSIRMPNDSEISLHQSCFSMIQSNHFKPRRLQDHGDRHLSALDKGGSAPHQALPRCSLLHCRYQNHPGNPWAFSITVSHHQHHLFPFVILSPTRPDPIDFFLISAKLPTIVLTISFLKWESSNTWRGKNTPRQRWQN